MRLGSWVAAGGIPNDSPAMIAQVAVFATFRAVEAGLHGVGDLCGERE